MILVTGQLAIPKNRTTPVYTYVDVLRTQSLGRFSCGLVLAFAQDRTCLVDMALVFDSALQRPGWVRVTSISTLCLVFTSHPSRK